MYFYIKGGNKAFAEPYRYHQCRIDNVYVSCTKFCYFFVRLIGGCPRSRTANVYHEGPDLQSGDAHAIASRTPKTSYGTPGSSTGRLRIRFAATLLKNLASTVGISPHSCSEW